MNFKLLAVATMCVLMAGVLSAQQDISVEYPIGTPITSGDTIDLGTDESRPLQTLMIRIENAGTGTDLVLTGAAPVSGSNSQNIAWTITQPATTTLTPGSTVDFQIDVQANAKGSYSVLMSIASDDPDEDPFTFTIRGSGGKKDKKDDSNCSTGSSSTSLLILLAILSAAVVGVRLKGARS